MVVPVKQCEWRSEMKGECIVARKWESIDSRDLSERIHGIKV
jgi:hypothetical protein